MREHKKTSKEWCERLQISIIDNLTKGFGSIEYFEKELVTLNEFSCRIGHCNIVSPKKINRREAFKMKQELYPFTDKVINPDTKKVTSLLGPPKEENKEEITKYSKHKTKVRIDSVVERQAHAIVNNLGEHFILEGATVIGGGDFRILIRDTKTGNFFAQVHPINVNVELN